MAWMPVPPNPPYQFQIEHQATAVLRASCGNDSMTYVIPKTNDCGNCTVNNSCICDKDSCPMDGLYTVTDFGESTIGDYYHIPMRTYMGTSFIGNIHRQACGKEAVTDRYDLLLNDAYGSLSKKLFDSLQNLSTIAESFYNMSVTGMPDGTSGIFRKNSVYPLGTCPACTYDEDCQSTSENT